MSYDTIKETVGDLIESLDLSPADEVVDFSNVSSNQYGNTYILRPITGAMETEESERLGDRVYDFQTWELKIVYDRTLITALPPFNRSINSVSVSAFVS